MEYKPLDDKIKGYLDAEDRSLIRNVKAFPEKELILITYTQKVGQRWELIDRLFINFLEETVISEYKQIYTTHGLRKESY